MTTYIGVLDSQWRWLGQLPKVFNSSPGVERTFCDKCGSPLSFRSKNMSGVVHFFCRSDGGAGKVCTYATCRF
ncbi:hypothetical protein [Mesorhizobium metallidurans]|uniref:hypothetical protein n=1 Tax=Mesorhizobium metallidurans TaxID=489722 RepID=UPI001FCB339E|nr:hypothetical protein [Mesorhizobium metallidurans]